MIGWYFQDGDKLGFSAVPRDGAVYMSVERPSIDHKIEDGEWVLDSASFTKSIESALIESRNKKTYSSIITISNGAQFLCDEETREKMVGTFVGMQADNASVYANWKAVNGHYDLTVAEVQEAGVAIMHKFSQGFNAEKVVLDAHASTPFTSVEDALAAFETAYNGG